MIHYNGNDSHEYTVYEDQNDQQGEDIPWFVWIGIIVSQCWS